MSHNKNPNDPNQPAHIPTNQPTPTPLQEPNKIPHAVPNETEAETLLKNKKEHEHQVKQSTDQAALSEEAEKKREKMTHDRLYYNENEPYGNEEDRYPGSPF